ncbi:Small nuclear ribonucleoprotein SmD3b [Vitis vinifera]|uniref:Small nuclear ribonucleoprotein SmD3b n=1 Tax=Vitis vinifera TaxID=29760 RepID=A0A438EKG4_VITVI|nr:Small nuclear ribonucleoprotein SmD3b [Vitis vinifera]
MKYNIVLSFKYYGTNKALGQNFSLLSLFSAAHILLSSIGWKVSQLEHVFIRGSKVRFMVIPDMLKNAPMFKRLDARVKVLLMQMLIMSYFLVSCLNIHLIFLLLEGQGSALGVGRGRAVAMRARAQAAGRGAPPGRGVAPPGRRRQFAFLWALLVPHLIISTRWSYTPYCSAAKMKDELFKPSSRRTDVAHSLFFGVPSFHDFNQSYNER